MAKNFVPRMIFVLICFILVFFNSNSVCAVEHNKGLLVYTVATEPTNGYVRFMKSTEKYGIQFRVLGMGLKWTGGDIQNTVGGGQKVNLLKEALSAYKDADDQLVMFIDSYDVVFTASEENITKVFNKFDTRVLFSAELYCWPDASLEQSYPVVKQNEYRYLNSGGFMGYASDLYRILTHAPIADDGDDQLYYTRIFLNEDLRGTLRIKLDTRAEIFQNLNGVLAEVKVKFRGSHSYLYNLKTGTVPLIVHGNGPINTEFNSLTNYLADNWTPTTGCQGCKENTITLHPDDLPRVFIALFIDKPTPFVSLFLGGIQSLKYPKDKISIYFHNMISLHDRDVDKWFKEVEGQYNSMKLIKSDNMNNWDSRNNALEECLKADCQYYLNVDAEVQITNIELLTYLIEVNRSVVAPAIVRTGKMWSTFWGALSNDGYYKRADDYSEIIQGEKRGLWVMPHIAYIYLIHGHLLPKLKGIYRSGNLDADMAFSKNNRKKDVLMYVDNRVEFGYLTNPDMYQTNHLHNDFWELLSNKKSWERKYIHPKYWEQREEGVEIEQPCPDVFIYPIVTDVFTEDFIAEAENYGKWSDGGHKDNRLAGGYENVPTVDIHMRQLLWEAEWLTFLRDYITPITHKLYNGYISMAQSTMSFMVRYKPNEQDHLRPHLDTSTYSINMGLNRAGIDFEGGGTRFLRYNCTAHSKRGYIVTHPGRLTHMHEGLQTTNGTRYIMVCFIDP